MKNMKKKLFKMKVKRLNSNNKNKNMTMKMKMPIHKALKRMMEKTIQRVIIIMEMK